MLNLREKVKDIYSFKNKRVFWRGRELPECDTNTFEVLTDYYSKDNNHVFGSHKVIRDADADTFQIIKGHYAKDKRSVFYFEYKIQDADPKSFELLDDFYSIDAKNCYKGGMVKVEKINCNTVAKKFPDINIPESKVISTPKSDLLPKVSKDEIEELNYSEYSILLNDLIFEQIGQGYEESEVYEQLTKGQKMI